MGQEEAGAPQLWTVLCVMLLSKIHWPLNTCFVLGAVLNTGFVSLQSPV